MPKGLKHGKARAGKLTIIIGTMSYCLVPRGGGGGGKHMVQNQRNHEKNLALNLKKISQTGI